MYNKGYRVINPNCIISITHCYRGVQNWTTGEVITKDSATIIETDIITYVVDSLISPYTSDFHIPEDLFLDELNSKKSKYRAVREDGKALEGMLFINQEKIKIRDVCPNGVKNIADNTPVTHGTTTVIRTSRKTFVCEGVYHHNPTSKYIEVNLASVKGMSPTKSLSFTFA